MIVSIILMLNIINYFVNFDYNDFKISNKENNNDDNQFYTLVISEK